MLNFNWTRFYEEHPLNHVGTPWKANVRTATYSYDEAFKDVLKFLDLKKTDSVLEVGAGTGEMMDRVAPYVKEVIGSDWSGSMVKIATERHPSFSFHKAPMHSLPFVDQRFDKVFTLGVIQYVPPDLFEASITEQMRVLKPGGLLLVGDVSENTPVEAGIHDYSIKRWNSLGYKNMTYKRSYFENRLHVIIKKP